MKSIHAGNARFWVSAAVALILGGNALAQTVASPVSVGPVSTAGITAPAAVATPAAAPITVNALPAAPAGAVNLNSLTGQPGAARSAEAISKASDSESQENSLNRPLEKTAFQQFVQENAGVFLPLFGYDLFSGKRFSSLRDVPVPNDYVVGPGDEIRLQTWGSVDGNLNLVVDRNGQVSIPKVGVVNVAGLKESQLESTLRSQISRYFNNFQLSVSMGQLRSMQVFVVGQAQRPGTYTVSGLSTLLSILFESNGPAATGTMRNIQLKRGGKLVTTMDLYKFIGEGDKSGDMRLLPGDVIVIPPAGPRVALMGSLDKPAIYELIQAEEPLGKVLSYAGRTSVLTTPHKVLLERIDTAQQRAARKVEQLDLSSSGLRQPVKDGDVITLLKVSPEFSNAVTLRGNVAAPLRYPYRPNMRVSDLIPERNALIQSDYYKRKNMMVQYEAATAITDQRILSDVKNLLNEINWDYASIERIHAQDLRTELIPFNLGRALTDPNSSENIALLPGDVVTIFSIKDIPISTTKRVQYVTVAGEVNAPGVYQITPGETMNAVIARAGGLTQTAYVYGTTFTRESNRLQQQKNLDLAIQRMEADLNSQALTYTQNTKSDDKGQLRETFIRGQQATIARLAKLKSSGRIALEMSPQDQILPPLPLEDMDTLHIPTKSSFISVFGAVVSEASFLHRDGMTVRDYINRAGLTRDADQDQIVILRADGSAEVDYQNTQRWFGSTSIMRRPLYPGDAIYVPEKIDRRTPYNRFIDGAKDWTAILYQFGLGAASIRLLKN